MKGWASELCLSAATMATARVSSVIRSCGREIGLCCDVCAGLRECMLSNADPREVCARHKVGGERLRLIESYVLPGCVLDVALALVRLVTLVRD